MKTFLGVQALNNLPTKVKYDIFDKEVGNCNGSYIENNAKNLLGTKGVLANVSKKIYNALCYSYNQYNIEEFNNTDCDYLYFWLFDMLDKNLIDENSFYNAMLTLKFILENANLSTCNFNKYSNDRKKNRDIKHLFDFSKDFFKIEEYVRTPNNPCNDSFNLLLGEYVMKYTQCKNMCSESYDTDESCRAFKEYFKGKDNLNLTQWKCNVVSNVTYPATSQLVRLGQPSIQEKLLITEPYSLEQNRIYTGGEQTSEEIDGEIGGTEEEGAEIKAPDTEDAEINGQDTEDTEKGVSEKAGAEVPHVVKEYEEITAYTLDVQQLMNENSEESPSGIRDTESSARIYFSDDALVHSPSNSVVTAPLVIGITVFFIILCKFTPTGYWLKKVLVGKYKRKRNIIMNRNKTKDYSILENLDSPRSFNVSYSNI
ncbi:variable surface protein [Plasmodium gonderi]|uniref:Variable surface protein n=1 Tax=Plasmodium gonderi TaxID=77519 RepID=A0A1Y1JP10_PLAGO|nr:variable surface protein [Plasmodium gonderi]GAW84209.1 variable surface protein [Plasmodium gonderi]